MPSLDTNCLLRWVLGDEPEQARRVQRLLDDGRTYHVDDGVVAEVVFVLETQANVSRASIVSAIEAIIAQSSISLDRDLWKTILATYLSHPKLSVADIRFAAVARRDGRTPLYTFDRKMVSQLDGCELPPE